MSESAWDAAARKRKPSRRRKGFFVGRRTAIEGAFSIKGSLRHGWSLLTVPWTALSIDFISFVSFTNAIQATGTLTLSLVGLTPTEHACLTWTYYQRINVSGVTIVAT